MVRREGRFLRNSKRSQPLLHPNTDGVMMKPNTTNNPSFIEPMKALPVEKLPEGDWVYEIKFDGYRALALKGPEIQTGDVSLHQLAGEEQRQMGAGDYTCGHETLPMGQASAGRPDQIHRVDVRRSASSAGIPWVADGQGRQRRRSRIDVKFPKPAA